jgi:hypothetical protein
MAKKLEFRFIPRRIFYHTYDITFGSHSGVGENSGLLGCRT